MSEIRKLLETLQSSNAHERCEACETLRAMPSIPDGAISALRLATQDADPDVADAARRTLVIHTSPAPCTQPPSEIAARRTNSTLAELARIQAETTNWKARIRTFALSLLAFAVAGWALAALLDAFTALDLVTLIVVVFLHEAGHYAGMRYFGYRNLSMFFIPFFGAAVTGYACVPVAKESVVYLLGPVPGIFIGYLSGAAYLATHNRAWLEVAQAFLVVNALNLMPFYPLDGGRFLYGILPRSTRRSQWMFQVALLVLMFGVDLALGIPALDALVCFAAFGTPHLYRLNKVTAKLIERGMVGVEADRGTIPPHVAREVVQVVYSETSLYRPKQMAELAWAAWVRAQARRPTVRQAITLLAGYVLVLLTSLLAVQMIHQVALVE